MQDDRGDDPVIDGLADPALLARRLRTLAEGERLTMRGVEPLGRGAPGYAPDPGIFWWVRLQAGSADVEASTPMGESPRRRRAERVLLSSSDHACCTDPACNLMKRLGAVEIASADGGEPNLVVAEALALDDASLRRVLGPVARGLAGALGVPTEAGGDDEETSDVAPAADEHPPAASLARHCMRWEGSELVLRDHGTHGPRDRAPRLTITGLLLVAAALSSWAAVAYVRDTWSLPATLGLAGVAAIVTLTAYAFLGVARFARKYVAASAPLVRLSRARVTVMPWVSRSGAVDLRPEGRFGAAIPLNEVRKIVVVPRDGAHAVEIDTDHGPMDAIVTVDERVADFWRRALDRAIASVAHPGAKVSAKQRARQRAT